MDAERWEIVVALFEQALQQAPSERRSFVEAVTHNDASLRDDVLALLQGDAAVHPVFAMTPAALASAVRVTAPASFADRQIGAYKLVREIGRGGMATVYHGEDTKHHRAVALKLLDANASTALGSTRFRREIEMLARLQHPHVLPLYDSGESDGLLYYVMPLVAGGTLRDRIAREGALPPSEVRAITHQIAGGLEYAHRQGVVHRDVKPANVLLADEHATIADFGIALQPLQDAGDRLTATGMFIGTPTYMSPEQIAGVTQLDARSDTYSLACVVYEMLTGKPPFEAASPNALLGKHLHEAPPPLRSHRAELPPALEVVLARALAKDPEARYATTREFAQELDAAFTAPATVAPRARALGKRQLAWVGAAFALAVLALAWPWFAKTESLSVAVLPFVNMSGDAQNDYFSDGVTEELTGALGQLGRLRVAPRTATFAYKGKTGDIRRIGDELGVSRLVEGSVRRDGDRVIFLATLYDANNGERLWSNRYERDWGTVLALQTEIAVTIAEQLRVRLVPAERNKIARRHSDNADAYASYLRGRYFFDIRTAASLEQALPHFERAIALDSSYARAYAGLADTYSILAWTGSGAPRELFANADVAARRALALDSTIAEVWLSLGIIHTFHNWDWAAANRAMARALAIDSTFAMAWFWRGWPMIAEGRALEGLQALRRALQLEPFSLIANARIGTMYTWLGMLDSAETAVRAALELEPNYPVARLQLARVLSLRGRHNEARAALPLDTVQFGSFESGIAGFVLARAGLRDSARALARNLEKRAYVPAEGVAAIYAALGEHEAALNWLERALQARGVGLAFLAAEPMYASLRHEPRYRRIVEQLKLAPPR